MAILGDEQKKLQKERENLLTKQFAGARAKLGGAQRETQRQSKQGFDRLKAQTGSAGGSIEKARQSAVRDVGRSFGELEAGLESQEAAARDQLKAQESALLESAESRGLQKEMFEFQKDSFAEQMSFQWAEFDENLKTNFINAAIALKDAGLKSSQDWSKLFSGLSPVFGERVSQDFSPAVQPQRPTAQQAAIQRSRNPRYVEAG